MKKLILITLTLLNAFSVVCAQDSLSKRDTRLVQRNFLLQDRKWTVEIPLWVPGFRGGFAYGEINVEGEDGGDPGDPGDPGDDDKSDIISRVISKLFDGDFYVKFFFLTCVKYENKRFLVQLDGFSGTVGESIKFNYNNKEIVQANFQTINTRLFAGYRIYQYNSPNKKFIYKLYGYVGVRAHYQKISSDLNGVINKLDVNPVWVEPIIGVKNQFIFKRWLFVLQGDYGGLLVNSKYSNQIQVLAYYRTGRVTSLKFGWNHLDLNHRSEFRGENLKIDITLSGPNIGLAFHLK